MFENLTERMSTALRGLSGKTRLTEDNIGGALTEVRNALIDGDVAFSVVDDFVSSVKQKSVGLAVSRALDPGQQFIKLVQSELSDLLGEGSARLDLGRLCGFIYGHRSICIARTSGKQIKDTNRFLGKPSSTTGNHGTAPHRYALVGSYSFIFIYRYGVFLLGRHHGPASCSSCRDYYLVMAHLRHFFCRPNSFELARDSCR